MNKQELASVVGIWKVTIHGPTGPQETSLELKDVDGALGGTQSAMGQVETLSQVSYDAASGELAWVNKIKKPLPLSLQFKGVVEGSTMSGKVNTGLMGAFPFTAVKS
jgi:hypothetical protein